MDQSRIGLNTVGASYIIGLGTFAFSIVVSGSGCSQRERTLQVYNSFSHRNIDIVTRRRSCMYAFRPPLRFTASASGVAVRRVSTVYAKVTTCTS